MTAEKLHDAIGMLPADLIAEADRKRCGNPKVIVWKRYAALAACFALVACTAWFASIVLTPRGSAEPAMKYAADMAPAAAAPMEPAAEAPACEEAALEEPMENGVSGGGNPEEMEEIRSDTTAETSTITTCSVETPLKPSAASFSSTSQVTLVTSQTELENYLADKDWIYDFAQVWEVCEAFDEAWFEDHDLLLLTVRAAYADVAYTVTSIEDTSGTDPKGWDWYVFYTTAGEGHPEGRTTCVHLLTELEKGLIAPEDSILTIADPID